MIRKRYELIEYDKDLLSFSKDKKIFVDENITLTTKELPETIESQSTYFKIRSIDPNTGKRIIYPNMYQISVYKRKRQDTLDIKKFAHTVEKEYLENTNTIVKFYGLDDNVRYSISNVTDSLKFNRIKNIRNHQEVQLSVINLIGNNVQGFDVYGTIDGKTTLIKRIYVRVIKIDDVPDNFTLYPQTHKDTISHQFYSSSVTITGINVPVNFSVTNGEASLDNKNFSTHGVVNNNQVLIVRSFGENYKKTVTLSVGTKQSSIELEPLIKIQPNVDNFHYHGPTEAKENTYQFFTFYGATDYYGSQDNIRYSITNVQGGTITFNKTTDIFPNTPISCFFLSVNQDTTNVFTVSATDIATNTTIEAQKITVITKKTDNTFNETKLYPLVHIDAIPDKEYISSVILKGINDDTQWTVTNGLGSINGVDYMESGFVDNNQTLFVKGVCPNNGVKTVVVNVNNLSLPMVIMTRNV